MARKTGRTANTNDTATISSAVSVGSSTSTILLSASATRVYVGITSMNKGVWLKFQTAATDNDKKGIYLPKNSFYELPMDNIYTGEISAITDMGTASIYTTEY